VTEPPGGEVPLRLQTGPSLAEPAAVARLNPYHFARQFKAATGLPPHPYMILRRGERAKHLPQEGSDLSLAEVAVCAGFSDQSQLTRHFKRLSASRPGSSGRPQEPPNRPQVPPREASASPLPFHIGSVGGVVSPVARTDSPAHPPATIAVRLLAGGAYQPLNLERKGP